MKTSTTVIKNRLMKRVPAAYFPMLNSMAKAVSSWKDLLLPLEEYIDNSMLEAYNKGSKALWINPIESDKLPAVGDKVLFSTEGKTYYGTFTENKYFKEGQGATSKLYDASDCVWMYLPKYKDTNQ